jgi:hypothetical protein
MADDSGIGRSTLQLLPILSAIQQRLIKGLRWRYTSMSDPMPIKTINDIIKEIAETELENQQTSNTQTEEGECECQTSQN